MSSRTTRADWITAGLGLLRDGGEDALTIEHLCATLRRTKGSFYHHFADIAAYHAALLDGWASRHTDLPIAVADSATDVEQRRKLLYRAVSKVDLGIELAVQAWASRSPVAQAAVARVHERRIAYLAELWGGGPRGAHCAEIEYAVFLGALHLHPTETRRRRDLAARVRELLG